LITLIFQKTVDELRYEIIVYIGDLVQRTEREIGLGRTSLNEIRIALAANGLGFGMEIINWPPENIEELSSRFDGIH
jgi:DNA-directed RNA polymerase subunit alpha